MRIELDPYQLDAINKMKNGCILCGGVGSGKSRTALAYYILSQGGILRPEYSFASDPKDLYIITTARKRDTLDWEKEMIPFLLGVNGVYTNKVVVDSWNNIQKYRKVYGAFFIFDEQKVTGRGAWVKAFLDLTRKNEWILLSATPGDNWGAYIPVFIANGFYRNRTDFEQQHCVFNPFLHYRSVQRYIGIGRLIRYRNAILVNMDYEPPTLQHHDYIKTPFDMELYKETIKTNWNFETQLPIKTAQEFCTLMRKLCISSDERKIKALSIFKQTGSRAIIFYNYNYELDILHTIDWGDDVVVAEYNGHVHQEVPKSDKWVYFVQYNAGNDAWNCISTNVIIFYSENYSYWMMKQAAGRIDRRNTPYKDLYYYHFTTDSPIDRKIQRCLVTKKDFNESKYWRNNIERNKTNELRIKDETDMDL